MPATASKPVCGACGDRIGVYEPIWLALDDGTLVECALLDLDDHGARVRVMAQSSRYRTASAWGVGRFDFQSCREAGTPACQ